MRDRLEPTFGFNLHDQNVGTRVGDSDRGVAIALLAPPFDESREVNDVRRRAMQVASVIVDAIEPRVGGHVARYDEPRRASATGPILGAIIGGAIGNAVGHKKRNKQVGTVVGAVLGGSIGADIARRQRGYGDDVRYVSREVCSVVHEQRYEERLAGYRVTYRYGGETYTTELDRDPGDLLKVQVRVTPVG